MSGVLSVVDGEDKKSPEDNPSLVLPYVAAEPPRWLYRFDSAPQATVFEKGFETQGHVFDVGHHRAFDDRGMPTAARLLDGFVARSESPRASGRAYAAWLSGNFFKFIKQQIQYLQELKKQLADAEKVSAWVCRTACRRTQEWTLSLIL